MKKVMILISTLFMVVLHSNGQDDKGKDIGGLRAGFHIASMVEKGSKPDTAYSLKSFYIGIFGDKQLAPMLFFDTGIEYFQNGLKYTGNSKRVLHTVSVPVGLKVKLGPVFALGGVAANFKVSEKFYLGDNDYTSTESQKSNWFDIPLFAGAGVKVLFISVEARYHWGLIEVRNGYYNRYFQIGAAISL